jgi:hypothetical protein
MLDPSELRHGTIQRRIDQRRLLRQLCLLLLASQDETVFLLKAGPQIGRHTGDLLKL